MKLISAQGNPGSDYAATHGAAFQEKTKFQALIAQLHNAVRKDSARIAAH